MEQITQILGGIGRWIIPAIVLAAIVLPQVVRVLRKYERGVIFRLGKLHRLGAKGPGLILLATIDLFSPLRLEAGSDRALVAQAYVRDEQAGRRKAIQT